MDAARKYGASGASGTVYGCLLGRGDDDVRWLASIEIQSADGIWYEHSVITETRLSAWKWTEAQAWKAYRKGLHTGRRMVLRFEPHRVDLSQFEFLRGNEACAREWQDRDFPR